jgi:hypothetical protein
MSNAGIEKMDVVQSSVMGMEVILCLHGSSITWIFLFSRLIKELCKEMNEWTNRFMPQDCVLSFSFFSSLEKDGSN